MTILDGVLLLLLVAGLAQGYASGLIRQMASIVGVLAGLAFGLALMTDVGIVAANSLGISPRIAPVVGFLLVFALVQLGMFIVARLAETLVGAFRLTFLNRMGGAVMGALKAALLLSVLLLPLASIGVPSPAARRASLLYAPISRTMPVVWGFTAERIPRMEGLRQQFDEAAQALRVRISGDDTDPS